MKSIMRGSVILIVFFISGYATTPHGGELAANDLSTAETTKLFSGKTVEGTQVKKGYSFKAYFDPNGTIRVVYDNGGKRQGKWRVDNKGRKCIQWEVFGNKKEMCQIIVNDEGVYKEINLTKKGRRIHVVTFKEFTEGNPYGL